MLGPIALIRDRSYDGRVPLRVESLDSLRTPETLLRVWTEIRRTHVPARRFEPRGFVEATDEELAERVSMIVRERLSQRVW